MSVDWNHYEIYDPGVDVDRPLHELPPTIARDAFVRLMVAAPQRIIQVQEFLDRNGISTNTLDERQLERLDVWFWLEVEEDTDHPGRLRPVWYSVVNDLALLIADHLITRHPNLKWTIDTAERSVSYNRHVLSGFQNVKNQTYVFDLDNVIAMRGYAKFDGLPTKPQFFPQLLRKLEEFA